MKLLLSTIAFLIVAIFSPLALAQQLFWVGGGTGDFNTATNWNTSLQNNGASGIPGITNTISIYPDNFLNTSPLNITITESQNNTVLGLQISHNIEFFEGGNQGEVSLESPNGATLTIAGLATAGSGTFVNGDMIVDAGTTLINTVATPGSTSNNIHFTNGVIVIGDAYNSNNGLNTFNGPGTFDIQSGTFSFDPAAGKATEMDLGNGTGATGAVIQGIGPITTTTETTTTTITTTIPARGSIVTTGNILNIGYGGGSGNWSVTNGSVLQTGTQVGNTYVIALGANSAPGIAGLLGTATGIGSVGTLTVADTSEVLINSGGDLQLGAIAKVTVLGNPVGTTGGTGIIDQTGGQVNIAGTGTMEIGDATSGLGLYNLTSGNLNIGMTATDTATVTLGVGALSSGTLNQTGGALTALADTTFAIGGAGTGIYAISGGTADFKNGFTVGANGTVNQSGSGVLTAENPVVVDGTYNMGGGIATFSNTLTINNQLNINGGTLKIGTANLLGAGVLDFGGGTLKFTSGTTFTDNFTGGVLTNTSTIDASLFTGPTNTFTFTNALSGTGGINLVGNGTTTFNFATIGGGAPNTNSGSTGIFGGTLNAFTDDFQNATAASTLTIGTAGSPGTLNLAMGGGSGTIADAIAGNGTLNVNFNAAAETLTLSNTGSLLSTVNIVLGANTGPEASLTPGTLQVYNGTFGTISDNGTGSGVIVGTGTGTGTVNFTNATYTGSTTIDSGYTLNTPTLTPTSLGSSVMNAGTLNITGAAGIIGNVMSNSGTLNTTIVTGNVVNSGIFSASSGVNTVGGSLTNTGTVNTTSALPGVVNTPTFTIAGPLTSSGTLVVRANGRVSDLYQSGGAANLDNGTINVQIVGGGKLGLTTYTIVTGTGVTSAGLTTSPNTALFSYALNNTGTAEDLLVTQTSIGTYAQTPNERSVAGALDGSASPLFSYFSKVPLASATSILPVALEQLSPETLQYARTIAFENSNFLAQRMNGVDADLRSGYGGLDTNALSVVTPGFNSSLGRSLGSLLAYDDPSFHSSAPNGVNYYPGAQSDSASPSSSSSSDTETSGSPAWNSSHQVISDSSNNPYLATQHPSGPQAPAMNVFIGGDAILASLNQNQSAANAPSSKASYTAGGATAGIGFRMTSHLAAGVLFDYNHTEAKTDSNGSKTNVDSYSPGLFATYFDHGFYANGLFSFGYNNYSNSRDLSFLGETASSHPSGQQYVGDLDFGYDFHPAKNWVVGPTLGLTYTHLNIDSFTESGAPGADLTVNEQNVDSLRSRLGGHVIFQTNTGDVLLQPNLTAMWQHEYLANSSNIISSLPSTGDFTTATAAPSRDSALIGVGMTATLSNSMALYLNYLADVGADDYWAQSVVGGFKARF